MSSPADKVKKVAYDGLGRVLGFLHSPKAAARRTAEDTKALPLKVLTTGLVTAFKVKKKLAGAPAAQPERDFAPIAPVTHLVPEPAPAERAPAPAPVKTVAKKVPAKKVPAKKVPAKKVILAKTPAKKAPVKKAPAKKTTAPKTPEK